MGKWVGRAGSMQKSFADFRNVLINYEEEKPKQNT